MRSAFQVTAILLAAALTACAGGYQPPAGPPQPVTPQPAAVMPGLVPLYFIGMLEHVDNMPRGDALAKGRRGAPVTVLDAESTSGVLWDSDERRNYAVQMDGLIRFEQPGRYAFAAISNDGIRVTLDRHRIVDDPYVHPAHMSPVTWIEVPQAGWYPLKVQYFQKGGSAALKLLWQPPGATALTTVPASAFGHL